MLEVETANLDTQSVWLFLSVLCLFKPNVLDKAIYLSAPDDKIYLSSG